MEEDFAALLEGLNYLESEAQRLRLELQQPSGDSQKRDAALLRAARLATSVQFAVGPIAVTPGPGTTGGSPTATATTTCPFCKHAMTVTLS
jgi:hypothetical protein